MLNKGREKLGIKKLKISKAFMDYSKTIDDIYKSLEDYNWTKKTNINSVWCWYDDANADVEANKKLSPIVTELFLRGRKLNILLVFISQSYFKVSKL